MEFGSKLNHYRAKLSTPCWTTGSSQAVAWTRVFEWRPTVENDVPFCFIINCRIPRWSLLMMIVLILSAPCGCRQWCRRFGGTFYLHLQDWMSSRHLLKSNMELIHSAIVGIDVTVLAHRWAESTSTSTLKMEAACASKTLATLPSYFGYACH
jgi:hypothetical protein